MFKKLEMNPRNISKKQKLKNISKKKKFAKCKMISRLIFYLIVPTESSFEKNRNFDSISAHTLISLGTITDGKLSFCKIFTLIGNPAQLCHLQLC